MDLLLAAALALATPVSAEAVKPPKPEAVSFKAGDGTPLSADYLPAKPGKPTAILLHGVAAGKSEWWRLSAALAERGVGSFALDFRGHGQSGGPRYETFGFREWAGLYADINDAVRHLESTGVPLESIALVGGSLGANLAAVAAHKQSKITCLALLSAGVEYRGVELARPLAAFTRPLFVGAAPTDRYAFETMAFLRGLVAPKRATFVQAAQGHGAQLLDEPAFLKKLAGWLERSCVTPKPAPRPPKP